ncbi:MAG: ABC transporter ATP-binding protein [Nanoarchaeota archaeon]
MKKPLSTESLQFSYSDQEVLRNISFDAKQGKIIAIIGKSGSGKSTFLKLVSGIIPTGFTGSIRIFGMPRIFEKRKIGFVAQELSFIPDLNLLDNIKLCGLNLGITEKLAVKKAKELMSVLRLNESLTKKPTELSGGEKVRFNIILSILHNPKIIILDEPFVGLDFLNRRLLWHFIGSMKKQKRSIILTSHLLSETQEHADRLVILKNGKIFFNGKLESLKEKLKFRFIFEVRFLYFSESNLNKIKRYCDYKDVQIVDHYQKYLMFAIPAKRSKDALLSFFDKLKLSYEEVSFREPNLDEIFLKT